MCAYLYLCQCTNIRSSVVTPLRTKEGDGDWIRKRLPEALAISNMNVGGSPLVKVAVIKSEQCHAAAFTIANGRVTGGTTI